MKIFHFCILKSYRIIWRFYQPWFHILYILRFYVSLGNMMNYSFFITYCLSMNQWYRGYEWMLSKFLPCLFTNQQIVPRGFYVQHFIRTLCWDDEKCLHTHADVPNLRNAWLIYHSIWGVTSIRCCILRIVVKRIAQHKDLTMNFISLIRYVVIRIDWFQYFLNSNMSCIF